MVTTQAASNQERGLGELLGDLSQEMLTLVRQELNLAKLELTQKAIYTGTQVGIIAVGGVLAFVGLLAIIAGIVLLISTYTSLPYWASALIVGLLVSAIGGALAMKGLGGLKNQDMVPHQTIESLQSLKP